MFKGGDACIVRLSVTRPADTVTPNMSPNMAMKLLRDGEDSANFLSMFSSDGQDSLNFFTSQLSNHSIPSTKLWLKPFNSRFATVSKYFTSLGLSEFASMT